MARVMDNICKLRDILEYKDYNKLKYAHGLIKSIFEEVHRHLSKKAQDYSYQLDFTSQDLRETAKAISDTFKRWDDELNPVKNIKHLLKTVENGKLNLDIFTKKATPIMALKRDNAQVLTELQSLLEYHSVFLYFLEEASQDKFALKCTERIK